MKLTDSIQYLKGVGPKSFENYQKLGISTIQDLLLYFPFRYEDFAGRSIFELVDGEKATVSSIMDLNATDLLLNSNKGKL